MWWLSTKDRDWESEKELAEEQAEQRKWMKKITLDDAKVLGEMIHPIELKNMKTATAKVLQKLRKAGLAVYDKGGLTKGWRVSYYGLELWQKVRNCPLLQDGDRE